jgi:fatty acid desaturase
VEFWDVSVEINLMNFGIVLFSKERASVFLLLFANFACLQCDGGILQIFIYLFIFILIPIWSEIFFFFWVHHLESDIQFFFD